ncbi:ABC transporter substrate-binding protein [Burkholderiaceae bacterium 16]|nr:ABC transporter substrate-binding protein [Burkholderiaceae bacterium 16]
MTMIPLPARRRLIGLAVIGSLYGLGLPASAQTRDYPERVIKIVSVTSPGTGLDDYSRLLAKFLGQKLGQSVVIENRPGAGMIIGTDYVAKAAPDGYTLLYAGSGAMAANPFLYKQLPYNPRKDFVPVARMSALPAAIVVPGSSPLRTIADLTAAAKARPGSLNYGTSSSGYQTIMAAFGEAAKIRTVNVPYKTQGNLLTDVMAGVVDYAGVDASAVAPHIRSGKMRALAVVGPSRVSVLGDVPTIAESGMPELTMINWTGLFAPAGTPPAIVDRLTRLTLEFVNSPEAIAHYASRGSAPYPAAGPEVSKVIVEDQQIWKRLIAIAGIQPE